MHKIPPLLTARTSKFFPLKDGDQKNKYFFATIKYSMVNVSADVDIDVLNINKVKPVKRDTCLKRTRLGLNIL